MNRVFLIIIFLFTSSLAYTNDGVFRAEGNHLIPIQETDIKIKREILTIKKNGINYVDVSVYYEFFNPTADKTITVGFEAFAPSGDVDGTPVNGQHPFMRDFTVELNNTILAYKIAYVRDSSSYKNGKIKSLELNNLIKEIDENDPEFYYVYHFTANFKKGINIIKHTYRYELSGSVTDLYSFSYVLTSAKRWANKQIDDFTLILDLGNDEAVQLSLGTDTIEYIDLTEQQRQQIRFTGDGYLASVSNDSTDYWPRGGFLENVFIRHGKMIYNQKNFKPPKSLRFVSFAPHLYERNEESFKYFIPFSKSAWFYFIENSYHLNGEIESEVFCKEIMKNIPLARKGYEFKDEYFNELFSKHTNWYRPKEKNK